MRFFRTFKRKSDENFPSLFYLFIRYNNHSHNFFYRVHRTYSRNSYRRWTQASSHTPCLGNASCRKIRYRCRCSPYSRSSRYYSHSRHRIYSKCYCSRYHSRSTSYCSRNRLSHGYCRSSRSKRFDGYQKTKSKGKDCNKRYSHSRNRNDWSYKSNYKYCT